MAGCDDFLMPPRNAEILANLIPDAKLTMVPRAGHILPFEKPDIVEREVRALVDRCQQQGRRAVPA